MIKRKKLLIEPHFQVRLMMRLTGWVMLSTLITACVIYAFLIEADQASLGDFFYVVREAGAHPTLLTRSQIVFPALMLSLAINLVLSLVFALVYSHRLAGPIYRITQDMLRVARGEKLPLPFHLREGDELQEVALAFDTLIHSLEKKKLPGDK